MKLTASGISITMPCCSCAQSERWNLCCWAVSLPTEAGYAQHARVCMQGIATCFPLTCERSNSFCFAHCHSPSSWCNRCLLLMPKYAVLKELCCAKCISVKATELQATQKFSDVPGLHAASQKVYLTVFIFHHADGKAPGLYSWGSHPVSVVPWSSSAAWTAQQPCIQA